MTRFLHLTLDYTHERRIAQVSMRRPEVHNAFNARLIEELHQVFSELANDAHLHGVVLMGEGASFSAGADIGMMRDAVAQTQEQNRQDALHLADLLHAIEYCPCPVLARVHGAAMGGGVGLVAASDITIAAEGARFALSEVKLGIAPAVIAPFVLRKIGLSHARRLFVTGERFSAAHAREIGLVQQVTPSEQLDVALEQVIAELLTSAPQALRACKQLALSVAAMSQEEARTYTTALIARLRVSEEGQEGLHAFLEKRKPSWVLEC